MNSRELTVHALLGAPIDRFPCGPLAVHNTAMLSGISISDYTSNPQVLADCVTSYYEQFKPDVVWVSADTWVTAEAMGAQVGFVSDDQPMCGIGEPTVKSISDIQKIPPANPLVQGRFPLMCKALKLVKEQLGDDVFVVGCFDQSPFSLACALMGMEALMFKALDDPKFVNDLLQRCIEYAVSYALSLAHAGADMLSTGDSVAGLVGREIYSSIAMPAEHKMFTRIRKQCDAFLSLHICGNTSHLLEDMSQAGCDVLEIDSKVDISDALDKISDDVAIWGNIDPVQVMQLGTPKQVEFEAVKLLNKVKEKGRTRFVLSSGCTLAPDTPAHNIRALVETAKRFENNS